MKAPERERAVAAAKAIASGLGLPVDDVIVLNDSNRLAPALAAVRCPRPRRGRRASGRSFRGRARATARGTECPVGVLDPRVEPRVYERDDFTVTLWTFYVPVTHREVAPADYASALAQLHRGMRKLDVRGAALHRSSGTGRADCRAPRPLADARRRGPVASRRHVARPNPGDPRAGRNGTTAPRRAAPGQPARRPARFRFIDLETCCRGPVEFDLAHAPEAVVRHYPDVDEELLVDCRVLVLAMVAAWRWETRRPTPERCASRARPRERAAQRPALAHARRPHGRLACRRSKVAVTPPSDSRGGC